MTTRPRPAAEQASPRDRPGRPAVEPPRGPAVALLEADRELGRAIPPYAVPLARRVLVVPRLDAPTGAWRVPPRDAWPSPIQGVLVLRGLLARDVVLAGRTATDLLAPGDVVDPWCPDDELLPSKVRWRVHEPVVLGVLDGRFAAAAGRWPSLRLVVEERLHRRADRLASRAAVLQLTRVDQRVLALLWQLAEQVGRMTPEGVVVPIKLTHQLIGQLVGAQRPTVTLALGELGAAGDVVRRADGSWLLQMSSRTRLEGGAQVAAA